MGLWLGRLFKSEVSSNDVNLNLEQLQSRVLEYIFSPSRIRRNPHTDFTGYKELGYSSLESFIQEIPLHLQEKFAKSYQQDPYTQRFCVGDRCFVKDSEISGICTAIEVSHETNTNKFNIFVQLVHDSRRKKDFPSKSPHQYAIGSVVTEKFYFYHLLKKPSKDIDENQIDDMPKRTHQKAFEENLGLKEVISDGKIKESSPKSEFSDSTKATPTQPAVNHINPDTDYKVPKLYSINEELPITTERNAEEQPRKKKKKFRDPVENTSSHPIEPAVPIILPEDVPSIVSKLCGMNRGIQGRNNSCYLDALLFSLFFSTDRFDYSLLVNKIQDTTASTTLRNILTQNIATNLREKYFCSYEQIHKLRKFLGEFDNRVLGAMLDVEEVFYLIVREVLKEKEFFRYEEGTGEYMHQIFICEDEESSKTTTIQQLVENSFQLWGNLKLASVPTPAFIVGIPRSDGELVHFTSIVPTMELNLSKLIDSKKCQSCMNADAEWQEILSSEVEGKSRFGAMLCEDCVKKSELNESTYSSVLDSYKQLPEKCCVQIVSLKWMDLYSVICIRSAHYVCFTRHELHNDRIEKDDSTWLFFDSMAGGSSEVVHMKNFNESKLHNVKSSDGKSDSLKARNCPYTKRMMEDNHLCLYVPRIRYFRECKRESN